MGGSLIEPSPALLPGAPGVLTDAQIASWRERGFALVDGVLPDALLVRVREDALGLFPAAGTDEAERVTDFGSLGRMVFPAMSHAFNTATLHPRLLLAVAQLLDVAPADLRLTQSELWPKYGRHTRAGGEFDNADQRMHCDYPNHSLTHPPPWETPEAVELIVYLCDVEGCGGATALVPREGPDDPAYAWPIVNMPGVGATGWTNDRGFAEAALRQTAPEVARWRQQHLDARESITRYRSGSVLFYRHDTRHRGTPLVPGAQRLVQNATFRKSGSEWISTLHPGWAWAMYGPSQLMERLPAEASVEQRCVLGFPKPGHPYWTRQTLDAVGARYGALGMDLGPYEAALVRAS